MDSLAHRCRPISLAVLLLLLAIAAPLRAGTPLSEAQRREVIRAFLAERPFVHQALPRGKAGVRIEGDRLMPSEVEMHHAIALYGAAVKPGERAQITAIHFEHHGILFDINGGPVRRKKLRDRISIGVGGVDPTQTAQSPQGSSDDIYNQSNGSTVFLAIEEDPAQITVERLKERLAPVLDFRSQTAAEAFQKSLPPKLAEAVKNHHPLVGMDKDMVTYTLGRPPRRVRESADGQEVEEWIYGEPPREVQFIRFADDRVVRIEEMTVAGEKLVRTEDEVGDVTGLPRSVKRPEAVAGNEGETRGAPSLLKPGEHSVTTPASTPDPHPAPMPDPVPTSNPGGSQVPGGQGSQPPF